MYKVWSGSYRNTAMRQLIRTLCMIPQREFEREIAPGVRVQIRKPSRSFPLGGSPLTALSGRVHDAWDVLRGKAHASHHSVSDKLSTLRKAA
jgi:hypothetical protein